MLMSLFICAAILSLQYQYVESEDISKFDLDSVPHQSNGTKRDELISPQELKEAIKITVEAMNALMEEVAGNIPGSWTLLNLFKSIYNKDKQTTLWDQIQAKVQLSIDKSITGLLVNTIDNKLRVIEKKLRESERVSNKTYDDVRYLTDTAFPHNFDLVGWSDLIPVRALYSVVLIVTVYQKRLDQGDAKKCDLGKKLIDVRKHVILGMKEMIRKRYSQLSDEKWEPSSVQYPTVTFKVGNEKDKIRVSVLPDGLNNITDSIDLPLASLKAPKQPYFSWKYQIEEVETKAINFLMTEVVNKINNFFKEEICFTECPCPDPITSSEITLPWPIKCLGFDKEDKSQKCKHPCDHFGYDYEGFGWCYVNEIAGDWVKCKPVDIECCIKMPYDTPGKCSKKKKAKKMKKSSSKDGKKKREKKKDN